MRDIRITVRGEDFPAVSEKMIALGVAFQVEPLGGDDETQRPAAVPRAAAAKKKPAKKAAAERGSAPSGGGAAEAAARLRAMAERNRAAGTRPADEPAETPRSAPFDTES
jgi:hypothetical protein